MRSILNKKGDGAIGMSFGWIFSLILILFFIFTAIYGIKAFLNIKSCTQVGAFYDSFQDKVGEAYRSSSSDFEMEVNIPGIKQLCFANLTEKVTGPNSAYEELSMYAVYAANTFILPTQKACDMPYKTIKYLNLSKTTQVKNPLCFDVSGGSTIRIVKGYYDRGVTIK
ncbi:MAG: hypothetical protein WCI72_00795 [archaeon]